MYLAIRELLLAIKILNKVFHSFIHLTQEQKNQVRQLEILIPVLSYGAPFHLSEKYLFFKERAVIK